MLVKGARRRYKSSWNLIKFFYMYKFKLKLINSLQNTVFPNIHTYSNEFATAKNIFDIPLLRWH